jgi:hypothetical protein
MSETVQPSLLEQLRQRVQQDFAPAPISPNERLAAFGRGVLSNRGSFLDNLSAGLAGQQQAEAARREEGRKSAEAEGTLAYRDAQMQLEQAKQRFDQDPTNPRNRLYLAQAEQAMGMANFYRQGGRGATPRNLTASQYATMVNQAEEAARRQFPDPPAGMPEPPNVTEERRRNRAEYASARMAQLIEAASQIQGGQLPAPNQAAPTQGPQGPRVSVPLTGPVRPAPTER